MSPLWRDEIAISLAPSTIALFRRGRWSATRVVAAAELAVQAGTPGDFGPALARLAEALADPAWRAARARVVLADRAWARFAVVPWPAIPLDAQGQLAHARWVLADTYGEPAAPWTVTLSDTPPGQPSIACATPEPLRAALEETLAPAGLALASLQPRLVAAFNAWRGRLPSDDAWFVSVDAGSLSAVHLSRGRWDRVHTARLSRDWEIELERLQALARVTRAAGAENRLYVDAPGWMRRDGGGSDGLEWLDDEVGAAARSHELAMLQRVCS